MSSFSMASFSVMIWLFSWEPSLVVTEAAMTGRETPHARPSACETGGESVRANGGLAQNGQARYEQKKT